MGEANDRGTFEERKAAAITRNKLARKEQARTEAAWLQNLTPEEKASRKRSAKAFAMVMAFAGVGRMPWGTK